MGFSTALLANQKLRGNLEDLSPQTSDDEDSSSPSLMQMIAKQARENSATLTKSDKK